MTKTALDIVTHGLRLIGVTAWGQASAAEDHAFGKDILDAEFERLKTEQGFPWTFTTDTVPDELFVPMAQLVASEVAPSLGKQGPNRARAVSAMWAYAFPDDRADWRDYDGDGTVSDAEAAAAQRSLYF